MPKQTDSGRPESRREPGPAPWNRLREEWFNAPGDIDDFIFYDFYDALGGAYGEDEYPGSSNS